MWEKVPALKEDLLAQIKRQSKSPLSNEAEKFISSSIKLYNEKKYREASTKLNKVKHIESSSLSEIRRKIIYQLEKMAGLQ